jgi:sugar phosphate isomerase/epimerase
MKFGCCTGIENAHIAQSAGFDFIECTVTSLVDSGSDNDFQEKLKRLQDASIPVEACNVFLPGDIKVVGEAVNYDQIKDYLETALSRVKQIGSDVVVFGSGRARMLPEDFSREKGKEQILHFLNLAADVAEPLGITIVIEPLNRKESNMINSVPEAAEYAIKINRQPIQVLADFYHMDEEDEALDHIVELREYVKHIHVADTGRKAPGTGNYPYARFSDCVKRANYNGRISIECKWDNFEKEAAHSREFLQKTFA